MGNGQYPACQTFRFQLNMHSEEQPPAQQDACSQQETNSANPGISEAVGDCPSPAALQKELETKEPAAQDQGATEGTAKPFNFIAGIVAGLAGLVLFFAFLKEPPPPAFLPPSLQPHPDPVAELFCATVCTCGGFMLGCVLGPLLAGLATGLLAALVPATGKHDLVFYTTFFSVLAVVQLALAYIKWSLWAKGCQEGAPEARPKQHPDADNGKKGGIGNGNPKDNPGVSPGVRI